MIVTRRIRNTVRTKIRQWQLRGLRISTDGAKFEVTTSGWYQIQTTVLLDLGDKSARLSSTSQEVVYAHAGDVISPAVITDVQGHLIGMRSPHEPAL